ncbi:MAG: DUF2807 domain-containing protein [bacterium]|nr:DUF2807 domain-containing protein [bacterium]
MRKANMIKTSLMLLSMCLGIFFISSCYHLNDGWHHGDGVTGSGRVVEEIRNVGFFDRLEVLGSCEVFFTRGVQGLRLVGEDNILAIIDTHVENGTLVIDSDRSYSTEIGLKVYVSMEAIRGFTINGAGKIYGEEAFSTDTLNLEIFGAGKIELAVVAQSISSRIVGAGTILLEGSAGYHSVDIAGAGSIEAYDLEVKTYDIDIAGAGSCHIFVTQELNVVIAGAGAIYYKGDPAIINSTIAGAGKLIKI